MHLDGFLHENESEQEGKALSLQVKFSESSESLTDSDQSKLTVGVKMPLKMSSSDDYLSNVIEEPH